jgi:hypothetical protein
VLDEYDWLKSEDMYWAEYGSFDLQIRRGIAMALDDERREMSVAARAFDRILEILFPRWYAMEHIGCIRFPKMRLYYQDGSPSKLFVRHPLPRFVQSGGNERCVLK